MNCIGLPPTLDYEGRREFLFSTTDPSGVTTSYSYNSAGQPTQIRDDANTVIGTFDYDTQGRLTQSESATGQVQHFVYDALGNQTLSYYVWTDPRDAQNKKTIVSRTDYDDESRVTQTRQYEITGEYSFTDASQLDSHSGDLTQHSSTFYNAVGQVISTTDALDNLSETVYDKRGLVIETKQHVEDEDGNPVVLLTRTVYDDNGRVELTTDPYVSGDTIYATQTIYDGMGRVKETKRLSGVTVTISGTAPNLTSSWSGGTEISSSGTLYDSAGRVEQTTDDFDTETQYTYDPAGRLIQTRQESRDESNNTVWLISRTVYDAAGRTIAASNTYVEGTSTSEITGTLYTYDEAGRTTCTKHVEGLDIAITAGVSGIASSGTVVWQAETHYDNQGRVDYSIAANDPDISTDDARTDYYYDAYGRQIAVLGPVQDADGYANPIRLLTEYVYDSDGRQESVTTNIALLHTTTNFSTHPTYANITNPTNRNSTKAQETSYEYDALGRRTALTDPEGNTTTWVYNDLGQCEQETNELNITEYYTYDDFGRLETKTDRNGRVTTYSYDEFGRQKEENWLDAGQNVIETFTYTYTAEGYLYTASDSTATYTYSYDAYGRATSITIAIVGLTPTVVLVQDFDDFGNRTQLAASVGGTDDFTNDYTYNAFGRLAKVEQHSVTGGNAVAEKRVAFAYNSDRLLETLTRYADLAATDLVATSTYGYDAVNRLTSLTHVKGVTTLAGYTWSYDDIGNMTQEVSTIDGTVDYTNDATGQLTDADYDGAQTDEDYAYDENGNRVTANGATYVTGTNNRLLSDGTYRYAYDGEGNRTAKFIDGDSSGTITSGDTDITTYSWDHRDRLTEVSHFDDYTDYSGETTDQVVEYAYDYANRLVKKVLDSNGDGTVDSSAIYVYDGDQVALQFDHTGTGSAAASDLSHRYLWGAAVDQVLADEKVTSLGSPGNVLWPLTDHLGSARDLASYNSGTDTTTIANHRIYNSFGNLKSESNAAIDCVFGYTGRQFDEDTGLQNNLNRWYDPAVGRWASEDPIGFDAGDANLFRYVGNQPTIFVDPSGQFDGLCGFMASFSISGMLRGMSAGAVTGIVVGGVAGGVDAYLAHGDWNEALDGMISGAVSGGILGAVTGGIGGGFANALKALPAATKMKALEALFAVNLIGTGWGVATANSWEQGVFRGGMGTIGAVTNILAIRQMSLAAQALAPISQSATTTPANSAMLQRYLSGSGGRWGSNATRQLNNQLATSLERQGFRITNGAGRWSEEWIRGPGGGTLGGTWVDITATNGSQTIRIQTISTLADGVTPIASEAAAAARIRAAFPNDQLILAPKL